MKLLKKFDELFLKRLDVFLSSKKIVFKFFFLLVFLSKLPLLNSPLWWDEESYVWGAIRIWKNNFNPFIEFWSYKPPFLYELAALGFKVFGYSRIIPHLIIVVFAILACCFTFLLGEKLFSRKVGFWAAILLFLSPLFFTQSGMFHADLPLATLTLMVIYFYLQKNKWAYLLSAICLVMTKEAGILVIGAILIHESVLNIKKIFTPAFIQRSIFLLSPSLFFFLWMVLNKVSLGWYFWPYNLNYYSSGFYFNFDKLKEILELVYLRNFKLPFLLLTGMSILSKSVRNLFRKELFLFFLLSTIFILFYLWGAFVPRYLIVIQPYFVLIGVAFIFKLLRKLNFIPHLFFLSLILLYIQSYSTTVYSPWSGENDLSYLIGIKTKQDTISFIEENFGSYNIITTWPLSSQLSFPFMGYVEKPYKVIHFDDLGKFPIPTGRILAILPRNKEMSLGEEVEGLEALLRRKNVFDKPLTSFKFYEEKIEEEISFYLVDL
jgi:4-amino-4-deoxy-L-arabinose transferase-like glycosyltransferase